MGIIANGYPHRSLSELKLENKYQAYYATKMALWAYLLPNWDINNMKVNPNLTGVELERANKMLAAVKDIYRRGTVWSTVLSPNVTVEADQRPPILQPSMVRNISSRSSRSLLKPGCATTL